MKAVFWGSRRGAVAVLVTVAAAAAGVVLAGWSDPQPVGLGVEPQRAVEGAQAVRGDLASATPAVGERPAPPSGRLRSQPPGVNAAQWAQLQRELAGQPAELQRVADHLVFSDLVQQFRAQAQRQPGGASRALALAIDQGLDARLAQREMGLGEAHLLKAAVLNTLHGEGAESRAALAHWLAARPTPQHPGAASEHDFQRQQATLVAAWSAQPAAQRDHRVLAQQLEALRRRSFVGAP